MAQNVRRLDAFEQALRQEPWARPNPDGFSWRAWLCMIGVGLLLVAGLCVLVGWWVQP